MPGKSHLALSVSGAMLPLTVSAPVLAAPPEPLVISQLSDPDPNYVPPKPEPAKKGRRAHHHADEDSSIDQTMKKLGMVIGQAAQIERQRQAASGEQIEAEKRQMMEQLREKMAATQPN